MCPFRLDKGPKTCSTSSMENPSNASAKCRAQDRPGVREGLALGLQARALALANPRLWMVRNGALLRWDVLRQRALTLFHADGKPLPPL